jgi:hypothetical protein
VKRIAELSYSGIEQSILASQEGPSLGSLLCMLSGVHGDHIHNFSPFVDKFLTTDLHDCSSISDAYDSRSGLFASVGILCCTYIHC